MKLDCRGFIVGALAALAFSGSCLAQVHFRDIKIGSTLDGKGIRLGVFSKALPLPPGDWVVVARIDSAFALTGGGADSPPSAPNVSLALKSTNTDNNVIAMVVDFTPDSSRVNWGNDKCEDAGSSIVENFETDPTMATYACGEARYYSSGFKKYIAGASTSGNEWIKGHLAVLAPYLGDIPDAYMWIDLRINRLKNRKLAYTFYAKNTPNANAGDPFEAATREWIKSTGKAVIDFLGNDASSIPAFPSAQTAAAIAPKS